jgi:hypothetical protein
VTVTVPGPFSVVGATLRVKAPLPPPPPPPPPLVVTVNVAAEVAVPAEVVTDHCPDAGPTGTVAVIWVEESTLNDPAATPASFTLVAPPKFDPEIVTDEPAAPLDGLKLAITGAGGATTVTVNVALLVPVPPEVVTLHFPEAAPTGTATVICVAESTL